MMQTTLSMALAGTLTCLAALSAAAGGGPDSEIEKGDTRAFVIEMLGEPEGLMGNADYEILYFERGQVVLEGGKVVSAELVSEAEAAQRKVARVREAEARQRAADEALRRQQPPSKPAAAKRAPAKKPVASGPPQSVKDLSPEQEAELEARIAAGINEPPEKMSRSKLRRYRRGRSASALDKRESQITSAYLRELQAKDGR